MPGFAHAQNGKKMALTEPLRPGNVDLGVAGKSRGNLTEIFISGAFAY
jgi:hypothetical protein